MKIKARVNHGRWGWTCPDCGGFNRVDFSPDVCMHCFPGTLATAKEVRPGQGKKLRALMEGSLNAVRGLRFVDVPDEEARDEARRKAGKQGRRYEVELPGKREKQEAMRLLRARPRRMMNYRPDLGETIEDLQRENKELGI